MADDECRKALRELPAVHVLAGLADPEGTLPPASLTEACRSVIASERERLLSGDGPRTHDELAAMALAEARMLSDSGMEDVINASGIVLHTAIGRAAMSGAAISAVTRAATGYCVLQWDRETGRRGHRDVHVEHLLKELTGAEAATVCNNNAGATLLVLSAMAGGREVIVSRGQLVEIGGSFRIPEVMRQSGARMVEVGCTNRTHLRDYRDAITEETAAILRVHPSNYRIRGFSGEVPLEDLVALGREHGLPVIDDLGAGSLVDLAELGLPSEPTVAGSIAAGAGLVTSSGDKLIGGPQAGIITGRRDAVEAIRRHPLARALRVGKLTLAALEATLMLFREGLSYLTEEHPVYAMLAARPEELGRRAEELAAALELPSSCSARVIETGSYVGSGALPDTAMPSRGVGIACPDPDALARELRLGSPAVCSRIEDGLLKLDVRTLLMGQAGLLASLVSDAAERLWG